jgi:hypothetical protein
MLNPKLDPDYGPRGPEQLNLLERENAELREQVVLLLSQSPIACPSNRRGFSTARPDIAR